MRLAQERRRATVDRRSWSGLRSRSAVAVKVQREGGWGQIAERRVRARLIVFGGPTSQRLSGMAEIVEDRLIEQFVPHPAVERLTDAVLHRLARRDEMPGDALLLRPGEHRVRGEFGPVVGNNQVRLAAPGDDRVEFAGDAPPEIEVSAIAARHSLVTSSITLRMRKRRPLES